MLGKLTGFPSTFICDIFLGIHPRSKDLDPLGKVQFLLSMVRLTGGYCVLKYDQQDKLGHKVMNKRNASHRVERLLDAAADLIVRLGYDKTTIGDIASLAGVAKGSVYLHWASKDDLFEALIIREMTRMLDDLLARVEADPRGGSLPGMVTHSLLALQANPLMRALYTRDSRVLGDTMRHQDSARYVERFWFGKAFVETMQAAGLVRKDVDPESLAYVLSIISYGFTGIESIIPSAQAPPLEKVASALDSLLARGIALEDGDMEAGKRVLRQGVALINQQYQAISDGQPDLTKKA